MLEQTDNAALSVYLKLRDRVFRALNAAEDNGYSEFLHTASLEDVAIDICDNDPDFGCEYGANREALMTLIDEWRSGPV